MHDGVVRWPGCPDARAHYLILKFPRETAVSNTFDVANLPLRSEACVAPTVHKAFFSSRVLVESCSLGESIYYENRF